MPAKKGIKGTVYYCPELRLYRYKYQVYEHPEVGRPAMVDEADYKFDGEELEDTIVAVLASDHEAKAGEAKFTASVTALGRLNPHKIVEFEVIDGQEEWKVNIHEPAQYWAQVDAEKERREKEGGG